MSDRYLLIPHCETHFHTDVAYIIFDFAHAILALSHKHPTLYLNLLLSRIALHTRRLVYATATHFLWLRNFRM